MYEGANFLNQNYSLYVNLASPLIAFYLHRLTLRQLRSISGLFSHLGLVVEVFLARKICGKPSVSSHYHPHHQYTDVTGVILGQVAIG